MTSETTNVSVRISNIERNSTEFISPIRRCVSLGDAQASLETEERVQFSELTELKRNRKRSRPVSRNEPLSACPPLCIISTDIQEQDNSRCDLMHNNANFPRVVPTFTEKEPNESINMVDTSIKYSASSPMRSVVSCDADIMDDTSQLFEDIEGSPSNEACERALSPLSEKELCREVSPRPPSPITEHEEPVHDFLNLHLQATATESLLLPLKSVLSRLMAHPTYNRKGTFNKPVDYLGLGLKDYTTIVKKPMDLGTIKGLLQANSYLNHADVARDVRLVFNNAQIYNPPSHPINDAAKKLLHLFDDGYSAIYTEGENDEVSRPTNVTKRNTHLAPTPRLLRVKSAVVQAKHTCQACHGRSCPICKTGCTSLEPTLLICTGLGCSGLKIRRGSNYYCSVDGIRAWCQKCHSCLPALLPGDDNDEPAGTLSYKRDLLRRKNDEDVVERWITCLSCNVGMHEICAFSNEFAVEKKSFNCPLCLKSKNPFRDFAWKCPALSQSSRPFVYSFVSGNSTPQKIENVVEGSAFDAGSLPSCPVSIFVQKKVQERMLHLNCPAHAEKTLTIRVISNCEKFFEVPQVIRRHFRSSSSGTKEDNPFVRGTQEFSAPPAMVNYQSKVIALFQRIDGIDVCIFCMYVQEYNKNMGDDSNQKKRLYIAYLDSVEHLQPRRLRTKIYHEILVSYLATARVRGYELAHIWSCPPSRGNSFVFWSHPTTQRTPNGEHLLSWYHNALSHAVSQGIVTEIQSLFDSSFKKVNCAKDRLEKSNNDSHTVDRGDSCIMVAPPLLEGDFWMEEAARVYSASTARFMKSKKPSSSHSGNDESHIIEVLTRVASLCPAIHVATLLHDCIMTHSLALVFCRPVNAIALKLHDYHDVIKHPMDLGTIHSRCLLGEYDTLHLIITDIKLVFQNAMKYNPKGHVVHKMAEDMWAFTQNQLCSLARHWKSLGVRAREGSCDETPSCEDYGKISMRLGTRIAAENKDEQEEINDTQTANTPNLITGGTGAIVQTMVGTDVWLLGKRSNGPSSVQGKNKKKKQKKPDPDDSPPPISCQRRTESWLGDEVSAAVRRMRTDFFVCHLRPKKNMTDEERDLADSFATYVQMFRDLLSASTEKEGGNWKGQPRSGVADTRNGLVSTKFLHGSYEPVVAYVVHRIAHASQLVLYICTHTYPSFVTIAGIFTVPQLPIRYDPKGKVQYRHVNLLPPKSECAGVYTDLYHVPNRYY